MKRILFSMLIALALVAAACGDDGGTTTSAGAVTTAISSDSGATDTTAAGSGEADVAAVKSDAVVEATPDGWTVEVTNTLTSDELIEQAVLFAPCLEDGSFDLATVDELSQAAINVSATAPITGQSLVSASASVEVRVFESESSAVDAYTVLEAVLGTTIGRECVAASSFDLLRDQLPAGASADYRVEEFLLGSGDYGTSIVWVVEMEGVELTVFLDMVAYRDGACTVFSIFMGFGEPFPTSVAVQMMEAAINA
jgi:hypothetical protein